MDGWMNVMDGWMRWMDGCDGWVDGRAAWNESMYGKHGINSWMVSIECKYGRQVCMESMECKYGIQESMARVDYKSGMQVWNAKMECATCSGRGSEMRVWVDGRAAWNENMYGKHGIKSWMSSIECKYGWQVCMTNWIASMECKSRWQKWITRVDYKSGLQVWNEKNGMQEWMTRMECKNTQYHPVGPILKCCLETIDQTALPKKQQHW